MGKRLLSVDIIVNDFLEKTYCPQLMENLLSDRTNHGVPVVKQSI